MLTVEEQAEVDHFVVNVNKYKGQADFEKSLLEMINGAGKLRELMHQEEAKALRQSDFDRARDLATLRDHFARRIEVRIAILEGIKDV